MAKTSSSYKIFVFSWNTASVRLCETLSPENDSDDPSVLRLRDCNGGKDAWNINWRFASALPDFFPDLAALITDFDPDIVVIGFQEDARPGSHFHSHFLPTEMPNIGYHFVKRTKMIGLGVTTYKGALEGDIKARGLRLSIYAKPVLAKLLIEGDTILDNEAQKEYICGPTDRGPVAWIGQVSSNIIRAKGATAIYLLIPGYGKIAIICTHLPFDASSLSAVHATGNIMLRQNALNSTNTCFNNIVESLVLGAGASHVIYFGDFNYRTSLDADPSVRAPESSVRSEISVGCHRVCPPPSEPITISRRSHDGEDKYCNRVVLEGAGSWTELKCSPSLASERLSRTAELCQKFLDQASNPEKMRELYLLHDELHQQMAKKNIYYFLEGKQDEGPTFPPTCKMVKGRMSIESFRPEAALLSRASSRVNDPTACWNIGSGQRLPSWCDRILYRKFGGVDDKELECLSYGRFDRGETMKLSDHAGVYALLSL